MEPIDNKDVKLSQAASRRKFLVTAGAVSVPLLMLKSRSAWGSSSLNCGLSATASQIASVTANTGEQCIETKVRNINGVNYFGTKKNKGFFHSDASPNYTFNGLAFDQKTKFKAIFSGGSNKTFKKCIELADTDFERNMAYCFLYALYLQEVVQDLDGFPSPADFVNAYNNTIPGSEKRSDLERLVAFYATA